MPALSAERQLAQFISKYTPAVAKEGRAALKAMTRLVPGATRMVYDNYNFLVIGYGPSERASDAVVSLAFTPRWITLCFLQSGTKLPDPQKLLRGSGSRVRNVRLSSAKDLSTPAVKALLAESLRRAGVPIDPKARGRLIIKSISAKQRPRRPRST